MAHRQQPASSWTVAYAGLAGLCVIVVAIAWVGMEVALGHDESAYAIGGRTFFDPEAGRTGFALYRSVGMKFLTGLAQVFTSHETSFRLVALTTTIAFATVLYVALRRLFAAAPAIIATAALTTSWAFLRRSCELLSDIPSTTVLLALMAVIAHEFVRKDGPTMKLLAAAPLAAGAFYLRYGTSLTIVVIAVAIGVCWRRTSVRAYKPILATLGVFALLLLPHAFAAIQETGTPWGILTFARKMHVQGETGEGFIHFIRTYPQLGLPAGVLVALGCYRGRELWRLWQTNNLTPASRAQLFFWLAAGGQIVLHCLRGWNEPRYIFLGLAILAGHGAFTAWQWWQHKPRSRVVHAVVAVGCITSALAATTIETLATQRRAQSRTVLRQSGQRIADASHGLPCRVLTARVPQITWYSGCESIGFVRTSIARSVRRVARAAESKRAFAVIIDGFRTQPSAAQLDWYANNLERIGYYPSRGTLFGNTSVYRITREAIDKTRKDTGP